DGNYVVAIVPVSERLSTKALARAFGGKKATMADPAAAERLTGYVVGGISPLGQKRRHPTYLDETAQIFPTIFVSAGKRGLQVELAPPDLMALTGAHLASLTWVSGEDRGGRAARTPSLAATPDPRGEPRLRR